MIIQSILETIGDTPVLHLETLAGNDVYVKLEMFNPAGSVKDRIALEMVNDLVSLGRLGSGQKAIEATSGNTGIGLALVCASYGIPLTIVMPENMSQERIALMKAYGASVVLTPKEKGMQGSEDLAIQMAKDGSYVFLNQFENLDNPKAHEENTSQEILVDFPIALDYFVAGVGTGGTITGCSKVLKKRYPGLQVVAVEPAESEVLEGKKPGPHGIPGIGANFMPPLYDASLVDQIIDVESPLAAAKVADLAKKGLFLGLSSGAAIFAAEKIATANPNKGLTILAIAPDGGIKYMSMDIYGK
jgi:cysteine synthase A